MAIIIILSNYLMNPLSLAGHWGVALWERTRAKRCNPRGPPSNLPISNTVFSMGHPSHHWAKNNIMILILIIIKHRMSTDTVWPYSLSCNSTIQHLLHTSNKLKKRMIFACCSIQGGCTQNINMSKTQKKTDSELSWKHDKENNGQKCGADMVTWRQQCSVWN